MLNADDYKAKLRAVAEGMDVLTDAELASLKKDLDNIYRITRRAWLDVCAEINQRNAT